MTGWLPAPPGPPPPPPPSGERSHPPAPTPSRSPAPTRRPVVRLVFRDETVIDIGPGNPAARALQAAAAELLAGLAARRAG